MQSLKGQDMNVFSFLKEDKEGQIYVLHHANGIQHRLRLVRHSDFVAKLTRIDDLGNDCSMEGSWMQSLQHGRFDPIDDKYLFLFFMDSYIVFFGQNQVLELAEKREFAVIKYI